MLTSFVNTVADGMGRACFGNTYTTVLRATRNAPDVQTKVRIVACAFFAGYVAGGQNRR